jgi:transcription factor MBP1
MRRRADDWINATHILKVADLDKPARTRVLEKEVQLDIHEKVQGGYGKYQGTWVPQDKAEVLARKYNVYHLLKPILDFKLSAGDKSPPPAPKHTTAASNKTKAAKPPTSRKAAAPPAPAPAPTPAPPPPPARIDEYENYDNISEQLHDDDSPDNSTVASESVIDDDYASTRKRKRDHQYEGSRADIEHRMWADSLLDYFMLYEGEATQPIAFPEIPPSVNVNRPIDEEGHTALHWAASMGDVNVVKDLLSRGADMQARNIRGETPLIRAGLFANCYDRNTWAKMVTLLQNTITVRDHHNGTIFHHVSYTAMNAARAARAKHYLEVLLNKLYETAPQPEFFGFLNAQDRSGDTALHIATRVSRRCTKLLQSYGLPTNIPNNNHETVDSYLQQRAKSRSSRLDTLVVSSSPIQGDAPLPPSNISPSKFPSSSLFLPSANLQTTASKSFNRSLTALMTTHMYDFLQAGEADLKDRDTILSDTNRALHQKEAEVSAKRGKALELQAALENGGAQGIADLEAKERSLVVDGERLEEQIQHRALHKIVHQEETSPLTLSSQQDGVPDKSTERRQKLELARRLGEQQQKRVAMTRTIVDVSADAGMGRKGELMKGIIVQTLGVNRENFVEDVEAMVEHMEIERATGTPALGAPMDMEIDI